MPKSMCDTLVLSSPLFVFPNWMVGFGFGFGFMRSMSEESSHWRVEKVEKERREIEATMQMATKPFMREENNSGSFMGIGSRNFNGWRGLSVVSGGGDMALKREGETQRNWKGRNSVSIGFKFLIG